MISKFYNKELWIDDESFDITLIQREITKKIEESEILTEVINKKYCDDKINKLKGKIYEEINTLNGKIPKLNERTIAPIAFKATSYMDVMKTFKPVLWLSGFNVNFSSPSSQQIKCLMDSKITVEGNIVVDETNHGLAFNFEKNNQRIKSDIMFEKKYTFFLIAQKTKTHNYGRLFSSNLPNRAFGWDNVNVNITFKLDTDSIIKTSGVNTNLHCFIVRNNNGKIDFYDFNERIGIFVLKDNNIIDSSHYNPPQPMSSSFNFGEIVIGNPYSTQKTIQNEKSFGLIYEVIAFDRALSDEHIEKIKDFLKKYYPGILNNTTINYNEEKIVGKDEKRAEKKSTNKSNLASSYL